MKTVNSLVFHIELNRQRLQFALDSRNESLIMRTQSLLVNLHSALFNELTKGRQAMKNETHYLVFSESNQDGVVMTADYYRQFYRAMSELDRQTHQAIPVDASMADSVNAVLAIPEGEAKKNAG